MAKQRSFILHVMLTLGMFNFCYSSNKCPPAEELKPHCWCAEFSVGGAVYCSDFTSPNEVIAPIEACQGYDVSGLGIFNSTLLYLPRGVFKGTKFEKISLFNTVLMSLSNGPLAFEGLEETMVELRATETQYVTQWKITQLRELKNLELIDINNIHLDAIDEDFPEFPKMSVVGLIRAGISFLGDTTFAKCTQLSLLDLRHNYLSEMSRSMLPKPAEKLSILNLRGNELSSFPEDFFTEMPRLSLLDLGENQFITLQEYAFGNIFRQLDQFALTGNPIRCDCRIQWVVKRGKTPQWFEGSCEEPPSLKGTLLKMLTSRELHCFRL